MQNKPNEPRERICSQAMSSFGISVASVALAMLGLAGIRGVFEPASAFARVVESGDVRLVSERIVPQPDAQAYGRNGRTGKNGIYGHNGPL